MLELEQTVELEVSLEVLQFVGIADHSQMKNRDAVNQHPMSAITGLEEQHKEYNRTFESFAEALSAHAQSIVSLSLALSNHSDLLSEHGSEIKSMDKTLADHGVTIENMNRTLNDHTVSLQQLTAFSKKIAKPNEVLEVLENG